MLSIVLIDCGAIWGRRGLKGRSKPSALDLGGQAEPLRKHTPEIRPKIGRRRL